MIDFKQLDLNVYGILMKYLIKDKDTFTHSIAVAGEVEREGHIEVIDFKKGTEILYKKAYIVALLHDILEDTDCTEEELREIGCDEEIIDAIKSVTRKPEEKYYFDYIKRVSQNKIGTIVKIHDLEHNMDIRRLSKFGDYEQKRLKKYWYSWKYLKGEMKEDKVIKNIGTIV